MYLLHVSRRLSNAKCSVFIALYIGLEIVIYNVLLGASKEKLFQFVSKDISKRGTWLIEH